MSNARSVMQAGTADAAYPVQDSSGTDDVPEIERYGCHSPHRTTSLSLTLW